MVAAVIAVVAQASISVAYLAANSVQASNADDAATPWTIPTGGCTSKTWWLKGDPATLPGSMDSVTPTGVDQQKLIVIGVQPVTTQTDPTKYHSWQTGLASGSGIQLCGTTTLRLWLRGKGNNKHIKVSAQLYDCPSGAAPGALTCTPIGLSAYVAGSWFDYQERTISFGTVNYTVPSGRQLRVKIANENTAPNNSTDDARVNWNSAVYPSRLVMTKV